MDESSDIELLRLWKGGDDAAGAVLVQRHCDAMRRFFANKVPDAAADLTQQTFLNLLGAVERIDPDRPLRSYLFGIANNALLMHVRKRQREARATSKSFMTSEGLSPSPSRVVAHRHDVRVLLSALRRLPLERQVVLELLYWEGLSVAEIAEALEVEVGTVKSRLFRARAQLRDEMKDLLPDREQEGRTAEGFEAWARGLHALVDWPE